MISCNTVNALARCVELGIIWRFIGDNVDFVEHHRHERAKTAITLKPKKGVKKPKTFTQAVSHHWFGSMAITQPHDFSSLSSQIQSKVADLPIAMFFLSNLERQLVKSDFAILLGRVAVKHLLPFSQFSKCLPSIKSDVPTTSGKNEFYPFSALDANEQRYPDMIHIMKNHEELLQKVFDKLQKDLPSDFKVQDGGDLLTRWRMSGAKGLVAVEFEDKAAFRHLSPITFEMFHTMMQQVTMMFSRLFNDNCLDIGTMAAEAERIGREDANLDVKNHFEACKDFAVSFTDAYAAAGLCHFFGMATPDSPPTKNIHEMPPADAHYTVRRNWFMKTLERFVDEYVWAKQTNGATIFVEQPPQLLNPPQYVAVQVNGAVQLVPVMVHVPPVALEPDRVKCYAHNVLEIGMTLKIFMQTCKAPHRDRMMRTLKLLMHQLKAHNSRGLYALDILRLCFHQYGSLSLKEAWESFYALFVCTSGKPGDCYPADLAMEHLVDKIKEILKALGPNKAITTVERWIQAFSGLSEIMNNFDEQSKVINRKSRHAVPPSKEDERLMIDDIMGIKPFETARGRRFEKFEQIEPQLEGSIQFTKILNWIKNHRKEFDDEIGK